MTQLTWTVGHATDRHTLPTQTVPATVPGAVQLDWAKAHHWPPHTYGENFKAYDWMEDKFWHYTTKFDKPALDDLNNRVHFVCKGIDYSFVIQLNGSTLLTQEGMFTPVDIDLTALLKNKDNELTIIVDPAPKREGAPKDRSQADQCCKMASSYGWDWHPRLIPLGIWDETYLELRNTLHLVDAEIFYDLNENRDMVDIRVDYATSVDQPHITRWTLTDPAGQEVFNIEGTTAQTVTNPQLWWPNGHGKPHLYTSTFQLYSPDGQTLLGQRVKKVGFRTVALVIYDGGWQEKLEFPLTRNSPPFTLEVNGRKIFAKGSNWICTDIFPGVAKREDYQVLIQQAVDANFNLLRAWGGGIAYKESLYEVMDELGMMMWQEFPLACNFYKDTPEYLKILDQESKAIIKRLRPYTSVAFWSGGNELFNSWSCMTDQSLALRLLNRNCFDMDPKRSFIPTSPIMNVSHGSYIFRYPNGQEVFQAMPQADRLAYTEFGCAGPSPADYIRTFIPEEELFPPKPGGVWESHHAFNQWIAEEHWLCTSTIEDYFGPMTDLDTLSHYGMILQSQGYKCIYEESRRQKPRCSMALNWCYNEPWPTAAGNSLINYPAIPKPSYYAVAESCRPMLASARIPKFSWVAGEAFTAQLWVLNDAYETIPAGTMVVAIDGVEISRWDFAQVGENKNLEGPTVSYTLPATDKNIMTLTLAIEGQPHMTSEYTLCRKE